MIRVYTAPGSRSGRMVVQWLKENNLSFIEKNIFSSDLRINEIRELLERCENGTDDIISKNSKIIKALKIDLNNMKMEDLITFFGLLFSFSGLLTNNSVCLTFNDFFNTSCNTDCCLSLSKDNIALAYLMMKKLKN